MRKSDFIVITMKNSNCTFVQMENREFECSRNAGESMIAYAIKNYKLVSTIRNDIGDVKYIFN